ncbi:hypothetical protein IM793_15820 [Pedobacter sp. MR2016-19]|uniref:hypothetical protein n=1 Tax=Pedobacter sp. MR2016-19 TaxID=2780089 RepID=UPI001873EB63|nr:hypothetical protein [Pedobacter sp. MR2016-19]MBE5320636.1 hypothetical protein [Pedobacter sp. MR2016-19]
MLPQINNFIDLFKKLDYDMKRYKQNNHIYELIDCFMTINALPEWIIKSSEASDNLKKAAKEKIKIMKGENNFVFDETKLEDINHKLILVRLLCNHSKHKTNSTQIPTIKSQMGTTLPFTFPGKFDYIIAIGKVNIDAEYILNDLKNFWESELEK